MSKEIPAFDESLISRLARTFRALCDTNRLQLLARLACCDTQNVGNVASCCPLDFSVVSRHLATMREAGILKAERRGREIHYSVDTAGLARLLRGFADALQAFRPAQKTKTKKKRRSP